jgi:serine/threonine protein kinase
MSEQRPRCVHCAQYHGEGVETCPWTGKPLPGVAAAVPPPAASRPASEDGSRSLLGKTVGGKYLVRSILGRGGMGTVYEGVNLQMGRVVALKVLHPKQLKKRESVKRFHQEARSAGAIGHPNICEVYDIGALDDGCPYLVMERLTGSTLSEVARQGVLSFDHAIDVMVQVLSGLVAAHEKGIVHRDLKPDNIFLTERVGCPPVAKVLDFGVSKIIAAEPAFPRDADLDLTRTGMVMGTPYYMSPEQASGARDLDGRVDLYACGVILYEVLTGRRPFLGTNYHILLWNILKTEPPAPSQLRADLPPTLESVIARAMARDRAARYSTAQDFIAALSQVRNNLANYVAPPPPLRGSVPPPAMAQTPPPPPAPPPRQSAHTPSGIVASNSASAVRQARAATPSQVASARPSPAEVESARPPSSREMRARGFDDILTEIDGLKDFSLGGDEDNATTTLMKDEDVARIAKSARELAKAAAKSKKSSRPPPAAEPSSGDDDEAGPVAVRAPRIIEQYGGDETLKIDRPELPPHTVKMPKRR